MNKTDQYRAALTLIEKRLDAWLKTKPKRDQWIVVPKGKRHE